MSRLIDADILKEQASIMAAKKEIDASGIYAFIKLLNLQPTVDAALIRHARWAHLGQDEWCCNWCGKVITTEGSWEKSDQYRFCWDCGAKMDLEENI